MRYSTLFFVLFISLGTTPIVKANTVVITAEHLHQTYDSTGIKLVYVKDLRTRHRYVINIFSNKALYKSDVYAKNGYIYISDTLKQNDRIKITVKPSGSGERWTNQIVKSRVYKFKYSESEKIAVIIYKKGFNLFRTKPMVSPNFW